MAVDYWWEIEGNGMPVLSILLLIRSYMFFVSGKFQSNAVYCKLLESITNSTQYWRGEEKNRKQKCSSKTYTYLFLYLNISARSRWKLHGRGRLLRRRDHGPHVQRRHLILRGTTGWLKVLTRSDAYWNYWWADGGRHFEQSVMTMRLDMILASALILA